MQNMHSAGSLTRVVVLVTNRQIEDTLPKLEEGYSGRFNEKTQLRIGNLLQAGIVARGTIESFEVRSWHQGEDDETKTFEIRLNIAFAIVETGKVIPGFDVKGKRVHSKGGLSTPEDRGFSQALDDAVANAFESKEMNEIIDELKRRK